MRLRALCLLTLAALTLAIPAVAQRRRTPAKKVVVPPSAAYTITTSAQDTESLRAEVRLVQFIRALQRGQRQKAAGFLSSRVSAKGREDLIAKRWLPARVGGKGDFNQLFFWRDIQIRTQRIRGDRRYLVVSPRRIPFTLGKKSRNTIGVMEVPMLKEQGQWWVDLRR